MTFREAIIPTDAIARAIAFAIEQPEEVDVNEIVVRPIALKPPCSLSNADYSTTQRVLKWIAIA